jgi:hypothetical protein
VIGVRALGRRFWERSFQRRQRRVIVGTIDCDRLLRQQWVDEKGGGNVDLRGFVIERRRVRFEVQLDGAEEWAQPLQQRERLFRLPDFRALRQFV